MTKIVPSVRVTKCGECPHLQLAAHRQLHYCGAVLMKMIPTVDIDSIADFCPLKDAPPTLEEMLEDLDDFDDH